ncbi:hypothetical protein MHU86_8128 [Fragilaria crotonensis]|nr:hypothetical protein MHU86_8128 [Fragilaria crotonensis]
MMRLSCLNYMNVIAYAANTAVTFGIGSFGWFGTNTNTELSQKYQTLVTPIGLTFSIWGIIFITQFIFVVVQLLPTFRATPMVAKAIGYDYVNVCVSQIAWTLAFSFEVIWLSLIFMLAILYFLLTIVNDQYKLSILEKTSIRDYWLLKFPFAIHCGWILAAAMVNLSVVLVKYNVDADAQYYVAIGTLAFLVVVSFFSLGFPTRPGMELGAPKELIVSTFSETNITSIKTGALMSMIVILSAVVLRVILALICGRRVSSATEDGSSVFQRSEDGESRATKESARTGWFSKGTRGSKSSDQKSKSPSAASAGSNV